MVEEVHVLLAQDGQIRTHFCCTIYIGKNSCVSHERPYHSESTASRQLSEVKPDRAWLVLRWVTTLESRVLLVSFLPDVPWIWFVFFARRSMDLVRSDNTRPPSRKTPKVFYTTTLKFSPS